MTNPVPNNLALTVIDDGAVAIAAALRNNFAATQSAVNALIADLSGGAAGQSLLAVDGTDVQWGTPGGTVQALNAVTDYGADPTGAADSTGALQNFLNAFVTKSAGDLGHQGVLAVIPPGAYKVTSKLSLTFAGTNTTQKLLSAHGARLVPTIASGHVFEVSVSGASNFVRNLTIEGLTIEGTGATDATAALLHIGCANAASAFYRLALRDVALEQFVGNGCRIDGDVFESAIYSPHWNAGATNTTGSCLYLVGGAAGAGGSIDIFGGTMSGGLHNLYATSASPKVFGGTYLQAYNEGIYFDASVEGGITGAHVENAWQGGVASPGWTTSQAGIYMANAATLVNVTGTQSNNKMRYVARLASANPCVVVGGIPAGGVDYYLRAEGTGKFTVIGIGSGVTGSIHDGASASITRIGVRPDLTGGAGAAAIQAGRGAVQLDQGAVVESQATPTYSASITPDASLGNVQTITVNNGTAFTINPPQNAPDSTHSQDLEIEIVNLSGGAMGVITWSAVAGGFHFAGLAWANPANGNLRRAVFRWSATRNKWVAISVSAADY